MSILRHSFLLDDLEERVGNGIAYAVLELSGDEASFEVPLDVAQRCHLNLGLVVVDRIAVSDERLGEVLNTFGQHLVTGGILCLIGWTPSELAAVPPAVAWCGPDGRAWAPLVIEGTFLSWICLGRFADAI